VRRQFERAMVYHPLAIAAMGVSAKALAMDASLPMKAAD
jgi:hypothetical protein